MNDFAASGPGHSGLRDICDRGYLLRMVFYDRAPRSVYSGTKALYRSASRCCGSLFYPIYMTSVGSIMRGDRVTRTKRRLVIGRAVRSPETTRFPSAGSTFAPLRRAGSLPRRGCLPIRLQKAHLCDCNNIVLIHSVEFYRDSCVRVD